MAIPLNKILTISQDEFFKVRSDLRPEDYDVIGVQHARAYNEDRSSSRICINYSEGEPMQNFANKVRDEAEVVLIHPPSISYYGDEVAVFIAGTALIPKDSREKA